MVQVEVNCGLCQCNTIWNSQPMIGSIPAGNLLISCGILFSGSLPKKCLRFMSMTRMVTISADTFFKHQKHYLQPITLEAWRNQQQCYRDINVNKSVCLAGDGRADTPGHSAKFGSYSLMGLDRGVVIEMQLVQSNEVPNSSHMEKEGLIRSISSIKEAGIQIATLITDRHVQVMKWVRENMLDTKHCIDVWHVSKGLKKKLIAMSKEKECFDISPWIKSITNHLYWVAASTPSADANLMLEKWLSVQNHLQNVHEGHGEIFKKCSHEELVGRERQKMWLKPGTKVCEKFMDIVSSRQMRKDIPMLSTDKQTACLESYHAVVNHYAPKMIGFSYHGQLCRLILAALHFNENTKREQTVDKNGDACYRITYPKFKKGEYSVKKTMVKPTYEYAENLTYKVIQRAYETSMLQSRNGELPIAPGALCKDFEHPNKNTAVALLRSRYRMDI